MNIIDIHTHRPAPCPQGVVNVDPRHWALLPGQLYSVGLHPWHLPADADALSPLLDRVEELAGHPQVAAIGETGLDALHGAPFWLQTIAFKRQAEIAERAGKPLVIHDVKSHEGVIALRSDLASRVPWVVHGFRGKPTVAKMLLRAGMLLSFGSHFNAATLSMMPIESILSETDDSPTPIDQVIGALSEARGEDLLPHIEANTRKLLSL